MNTNVRPRRLFFGSLLFLAFVIVALRFAAPQLVSVEVREREGGKLSAPQSIGLPYSTASKDNREKTYLFRIQLYYPFVFSRHLHIIIDDCADLITISNTTHDLTAKNPDARCGGKGGIIFDTGEALHPGTNTLEVTMRDWGGILKLGVSGLLPGDIRPEILLCVALTLAGLCGLLATPLAQHRLDKGLRILLVLAACLYLLFLTLTDYTSFTTDIWWHMEYIKIIGQEGRIPSVTESWESFQPPLYYLAAQPYFALASWLKLQNWADIVRAFSLFLWLGFLLYAFAFFRLFLAAQIAWMAAGILILLPAGASFSVKICNDIALQTAMMGFLFHLTQGCREKNSRQFVWAAAFVMIGIGVKNIAVFAFLAMLMTVAVLLSTGKMKWPQLAIGKKTAGWLGVLTLVCLGNNFGRTLYYRIHDGDALNVLTATLSRDLVSGWVSFIPDDRLSHFLFFPLATFIHIPYFRQIPLVSENNYFWYVLLKTFLFTTDSWHAALPASLLSFCLLSMIAYSAIGIRWRDRSEAAIGPAPAIVAATCIGGLLLTRFLYPAAILGDARYIFFLAPVLLLYFGKAVQGFRYHGHRLIAYAGVGLGLAFLGLSASIILLQL